MRTEEILNWRMSAEEAEVFRIALIYESEYQRIYADSPEEMNVRGNSMSRRQDPRKSLLFKNCWKLRRETKGLIESHQVKDYIRGNFEIIKANGGFIGPNVVVGDKAWIRYKIWSRKYQISEDQIVTETPLLANPKLLEEIDNTKKFLYESMQGEPSLEKLSKFVESGIIKRWLVTGKVSPYYVILSSWIPKICDPKELIKVCSSSYDLFCEKITSDLKIYFNHEFLFEQT